MSHRELMTIQEVADRLGVKPDLIFYHVHRGNLEHFALGGWNQLGHRKKVGAYRISEEQFQRFKHYLVERKERIKSNDREVGHEVMGHAEATLELNKRLKRRRL